LLEKFAGYGFNKSHAAAYAIVAYQTAYLKANYPVEFFCAMMTNDMADTAKLSEYIAEARSSASRCCRPDVNESGVILPRRANGKAIRFGLAAIKGRRRSRGGSHPEGAQRRRKIQFASDLCERVDGRTVNRKTLEALIKSGACDCFGQTRATLFAQIDAPWPAPRASFPTNKKAKARLFGALEEKAPPMPEAISNLPEWPQHELLAHEKELLGFYVTGHPLTPFAPILEKYALPTPRSSRRCQSQPDAHRRIDCRGAKRRFQKERQAVFDGHARRPGRLRAGALHERELRQIPRIAGTEQGDSRGRRSQHRRRQARKFFRRKSCRWRTRRGNSPSRFICACTRRI
jgi:DNA polymerase III alpha subunit